MAGIYRVISAVPETDFAHPSTCQIELLPEDKNALDLLVHLFSESTSTSCYFSEPELAFTRNLLQKLQNNRVEKSTMDAILYSVDAPAHGVVTRAFVGISGGYISRAQRCIVHPLLLALQKAKRVYIPWLPINRGGRILSAPPIPCGIEDLPPHSTALWVTPSSIAWKSVTTSTFMYHCVDVPATTLDRLQALVGFSSKCRELSTSGLVVRGWSHIVSVRDFNVTLNRSAHTVRKISQCIGLCQV
jgi:hypothetical protein